MRFVFKFFSQFFVAIFTDSWKQKEGKTKREAKVSVTSFFKCSHFWLFIKYQDMCKCFQVSPICVTLRANRSSSFYTMYFPNPKTNFLSVEFWFQVFRLQLGFSRQKFSILILQRQFKRTKLASDPIVDIIFGGRLPISCLLLDTLKCHIKLHHKWFLQRIPAFDSLVEQSMAKIHSPQRFYFISQRMPLTL